MILYSCLKCHTFHYSKEAEARLVEEEKEKLEKLKEEKFLQEQLLKQEAIKRQIQQALNEQTFEQFKQYSEQQYPGEEFIVVIT